MKAFSNRVWLVIALAFTGWIGIADASEDIAVRVHTRASTVIIDVEVPIEVTPEEAWPTVTDYEHMAQFIPGLTSSRVLSRNGNNLRIEQKGRAKRGPFSFAFDNVRDVVLSPPHEIRTTFVSGSMRSAQSLTRLERAPGGMRLVNHGEYTVSALLPISMATQQIAAETREQFALIRAEVMRRHARLATNP